MSGAVELDRLRAWLTSSGGHADGARVRVEGGRRWLAATGPTAAGTELIYVPRGAIITRELIRASSLGRQVRDAGVELTSPHALYAAWVAVEARRPSSAFAAYFATLPPSAAHFPAIALADPHRLLPGTFAGGDVAALALAVMADYRALGRVRLFASVDADHFAWARMMVGSRAFSLTIDGIATTALVPLCDLLDHAGDGATRWGFESERDGFVLRAARALAVDEELTTSYGAKPNRQLLAQYGFALDDNPADEVCIADHWVVADPTVTPGPELGAALLAGCGGDRAAARAALRDAVAATAARYRDHAPAAAGDDPAARFLLAARRGEERVVAAWQALAASDEADAYLARAAEAAARKAAIVAA